jgi:hypothetical protein
MGTIITVSSGNSSFIANVVTVIIISNGKFKLPGHSRFFS